MDFEAEARRDAEETLRVGRDAIEIGIARARVALFGALTAFMIVLGAALSAGAVRLGSGDDLGGILPRLTPAFLFGIGLVYAFAVLRMTTRAGARSGSRLLTAHLDVLCIAAIVVTLRHVMASASATTEPLAARFDIYCLAPIMMALVILGCLRVERGQRLPFALFTIVVYLVAIRMDVGRFEPPQLLATVLIGIGAALGAETSDRIAALLDRHSRLSVLRSYLPAAFADRVSSEAMDLGAALRPQSTDVTLLVSDLRGFTATSEKLAPAEVVELLGEYHGAMVEAVEASGGVVDKFLGDGMLVIFGLPAPESAPPSDAGASSAARCAVAMLARLEQLNRDRQKRSKAPLAIGIGIHTGPVVAGTIGAGRRREFTVIGDAVNTASRLEGLTKSAEAPVLLSAATAARLDLPAWRLRELAPMSVKGKSEPVRIYALDGGAAEPAVS